jgi:hypothetical protein
MLAAGVTSMIYLSELEVGYDPELIGFPSIDACMAIVYVTDRGLFGFHNFGGDTREKWRLRANKFREFVGNHDYASRAGRRLYGATYLGSRGYTNPQEDWKAELKTFASALGFSGKIRGFNLGQTDIKKGAYVEFRKIGEKCTVYVDCWDGLNGERGNVRWSKGKNENPLDHKIMATRAGGVITVENTTKPVVDYAQSIRPVRVHSSRISFL